VVLSGEEGVGKLQGGVGKLEVGSIRVEEGREGVLHGEQGVQCCLLVLLGIRGRGKKQTRARNTAAMRWRPADGSGGRGARETGHA
jgi:hypothetical protein